MNTLKHRIGCWLIPRLPISRFAFDILRTELNAFLCRLSWRWFPNRRQQLKRLKKLTDVHVNVACGPNVAAGYLSVDLYPSSPNVIPWDCRRSLPFGNCAAKGILIEHFVEHVEPRESLPLLLADCYRVLQDAGVLRVVVP